MKSSSVVFFLAVAGTPPLAACSTAHPGSPASCAGINEVAIAYDPRNGKADAKLCGGKENENVKLSGKTRDGVEFLYEAQGAKAFGGQVTQAELNEALSIERSSTIREMINMIRSVVPATPVIAR